MREEACCWKDLTHGVTFLQEGVLDVGVAEELGLFCVA